MPKTYDAIVIGTGQAGPPLAARLADEGLKTAIVERGLVGGTCVNTGCIPTKALVASARRVYRRPCRRFRRAPLRQGRGRHGEREGAQGRDRR
jgi:pyruvate/2-oxoglutarate dehydrogenase complex dihydrolipoamide dehydrogenase (E3) component